MTKTDTTYVEPESAKAQRRAQAVNAASTMHQCVSAKFNTALTYDGDADIFLSTSELDAYVSACNLLGVTFREFA